MIKRLGSTAEIDAEIKSKYIAPIHYDGLVECMKERKMVVAFRPAGRYSIDKLSCGAAAKPHTILDKTIKPKCMWVVIDGSWY